MDDKTRKDKQVDDWLEMFKEMGSSPIEAVLGVKADGTATVVPVEAIANSLKSVDALKQIAESGQTHRIDNKAVTAAAEMVPEFVETIKVAALFAAACDEALTARQRIDAMTGFLVRTLPEKGCGSMVMVLSCLSYTDTVVQRMPVLVDKEKLDREVEILTSSIVQTIIGKVDSLYNELKLNNVEPNSLAVSYILIRSMIQATVAMGIATDKIIEEVRERVQEKVRAEAEAAARKKEGKED